MYVPEGCPEWATVPLRWEKLPKGRLSRACRLIIGWCYPMPV